MGDERQLHLFRRKRQRGVKPPSPKEFLLHVALADTLRRWCTPQWIWTHFPAGEFRHDATAARLFRMGLRRGFPDFMFFRDIGRLCAFLELKRRGEKPSDEQAAVLEHLRAAGHAVKVADSYGDAVEFLKAIGVLRAGVHVQ